ncbi:PAS domain S-box protein [Desulforhopalus sp. 52FAK]
MPCPPYTILCAITAAIIVPCFGRIALNGSGVENELYRYTIPLMVGAISGFFIGLFLDKWKASMTLLEKTNRQLKTEARRSTIAGSWHFALFEKSHSIILIIDPDTGKIIDANPQAASFYGYTVKELKNMYIHEINTETKEKIFTELKLANKEKRKVYYFKHRLSSGEIKDVEVFTGAINIDNTPLLLSFVQDITQLNRLRGTLSICSHCKKIRDKKGGWTEVEQFIESNTAAKCSHGICPTCVDKLYPSHAKDPRIEALTTAS